MLSKEIVDGAPAMSTSRVACLRLPAGLRLDSNESIVITTHGPDCRIVFVNPAFVRLTGFDAEHWIGRAGDLLRPDGSLRMESLLWLDTADDGSEVHWIARLHRRDGSPFCAEAHLQRIPASDGEHVVLVIADVTSRVGNGKSRTAAPPYNDRPVPA